ncbi:hypothetical protein [Propionivibrio dicarboxylicus]|uniref:Uncharacterized protein n=1 Tax=Propionivibrio dicarboxylicus TaxID=83767 RepID=A0A1G8AQX8_9RHOO|nr:hypothetical protein [Propionivibrio dicarboxylicus]SDH23462.1 hypothetical protein SAMN05660652_01471 [Propionivibrio dicarboxylicus]
MTLLVKTNEHGRRIGESHPRAVLTNHEVELMMELLDEREALIGEMEFNGARRATIHLQLHLRGLSYACLAAKFEVHKQTVAKIALGQRRCQTLGL